MLSRKNKNRLHRRLINTPGFRFFNALESGASQTTPEVKNLPTNAGDIKETWVQSPSWEDPLEEGMATHSSLLASTDRGAWRAAVHGVAQSWTRLK